MFANKLLSTKLTVKSLVPCNVCGTLCRKVVVTSEKNVSFVNTWMCHLKKSLILVNYCLFINELEFQFVFNFPLTKLYVAMWSVINESCEKVNG